MAEHEVVVVREERIRVRVRCPSDDPEEAARVARAAALTCPLGGRSGGSDGVSSWSAEQCDARDRVVFQRVVSDG